MSTLLALKCISDAAKARGDAWHPCGELSAQLREVQPSLVGMAGCPWGAQLLPCCCRGLEVHSGGVLLGLGGTQWRQ